MNLNKNHTQIHLTKGFIAIIDEEDYDRISQHKWYPSNGYAINEDRKKMHRLIMQAQPGQLVDHIDRNKMNNKKSNLRIVCMEENVHNQKKRENTNNNFKGTQFIKRLGLYQGRCRIFKNDYFLGHFKTEIAAAYAYNLKAKELSYCILLNELPYSKDELDYMLINDRVTISKAEKQSGHKNVTWHDNHKKWAVIIHANKSRKFIGYFKKLDDAITAKKNALLELQSQFN